MGGDPNNDVTDPAWESDLQAGQAAEGEAGSVEAELAVLRMLLHAREPAQLGRAQEDRIWQQIDKQLGDSARPVWWRRPGWRWAATALAAAVLVVWVLRPPRVEDPDATIAAQATATLLEQQFAALAPAGRVALDQGVDRERRVLRRELLAHAQMLPGVTP